MTSTVDAAWVAAPEVPAVAAPLRAVDLLRSERDGDTLVLTARVTVRGDDPNLRGHFPGLAVFPGIFIIEALCQAMALAAPAEVVRPPALRTVTSVRFVSPLLDGDELNLEIKAVPAVDGWDVKAKGLGADGTTAARIRATFSPAVTAVTAVAEGEVSRA